MGKPYKHNQPRFNKTKLKQIHDISVCFEWSLKIWPSHGKVFRMAKTKELSQQLCMVIIDHHNRGMGYRKICDVLKFPISTIGAIIRKWKEHGLTTDLPRKGRPRRVSERAARSIVWKVMHKPFTTSAELQKELQAAGTKVSKDTISCTLYWVGLHSRTPRKTSLLKPKHVKACLEFAKHHLEKPTSFWNKILWSDETKIDLFGGNSSRHVWRKEGTSYDPKNTIPTIKHGGGSIMACSCFSSSGTGTLHIIEGTMDNAAYRENTKGKHAFICKIAEATDRLDFSAR